jgi:transposase
MKFAGEKVYIGIDVHKTKYVLSASCDRSEIKSWTCAADPEGLVKSLIKFFPGAELHTVYEAGFSGFSLHRLLVRHGIKNIVVNPANVEVALKDRKKTDKRDAKKMSEQLTDGRLDSIYIPSEQEELRRQITRLREQLVKDRSRMSHRIKGKLHYFVLLVYSDRRVVNKSFLEWVQGLDVKPELKVVLQTMIDQWLYLNKKVEEIRVDMKAQSFEDAETEAVYQSVPGIGDIGARVLANELGDLSKRFRNQKALYRYVGLTPSEYSSGEKVHRGSIDRQGSPRLRKTLVEASWVAIKMDPALRESYEKIKSTRGATRAIIAIARKLVGRMRACFVQRTGYEVGIVG